MNSLEAFRNRHELRATVLTHVTAVRMPLSLLQRLTAVADQLGWKRSQLIFALLQDGLNHLENRDAPDSVDS